MDELALVDIKPDKGWFTWVNNRGLKPKMQYKDPRLSFKFDECWTTDVEAKNIIKGAWHCNDKNFVEKLDNICLMLGPWQRGKYKKMEKDIRRLEHKIDMVIDEGDMNTQYFHARATSRLKKNNIEKLKDSNGNWVTDNRDICNVAKKCFCNLFQSNKYVDDIHVLNYISECVTKDSNDWLEKDYTESEIVQAIKQMDPRKSPGVDSLSGSFFKHNWEIFGQELNFSKSTVLFSRNTSNAQRHRLGDLLRMKVVEKLDNCLGLPLPIEGYLLHF
ncbi:hypothetical protein GOBAR_DD04677 [Gossypium barbadense]|nr:hypothetical protein GOBAR_DD04677 [Gossypium barbadense]